MLGMEGGGDLGQEQEPQKGEEYFLGQVYPEKEGQEYVSQSQALGRGHYRIGAGTQKASYSYHQEGRTETQDEEKQVLKRGEEGIDSGDQGGDYSGYEGYPGKIYPIS